MTSQKWKINWFWKALLWLVRLQSWLRFQDISTDKVLFCQKVWWPKWNLPVQPLQLINLIESAALKLLLVIQVKQKTSNNLEPLGTSMQSRIISNQRMQHYWLQLIHLMLSLLSVWCYPCYPFDVILVIHLMLSLSTIASYPRYHPLKVILVTASRAWEAAGPGWGFNGKVEAQVGEGGKVSMLYILYVTWIYSVCKNTFCLKLNTQWIKGRGRQGINIFSFRNIFSSSNENNTFLNLWQLLIL